MGSDWTNKFAALEAANPGQPPPIPPFPKLSRKPGLGLLSIGSMDETEKAEYERLREKSKTDRDEWSQKAELYKEALDAVHRHFQCLSELGQETAKTFLLLPTRQRIAEALMGTSTDNQSSERE
jgi:hypothetical protein